VHDMEDNQGRGMTKLTRSTGYPRHRGATSIPPVGIDGQADDRGPQLIAEGISSFGSGRAAYEPLAPRARTTGAAAGSLDCRAHPCASGTPARTTGPGGLEHGRCC
jgi:hypothetical protein